MYWSKVPIECLPYSHEKGMGMLDVIVPLHIVEAGSTH